MAGPQTTSTPVRTIIRPAGITRLRFIGSSDGLSSVPGINGGNTSNLQAFVGGARNQNNGFLPGRTDVSVSHATGFGASQSFSFNTDFVVTAPASSTDTHDNFGFAFQDSVGNSLFAINFAPPIDTTKNLTTDDVQYTVGNNTTAKNSSFSLGSRYKLTVNVNVLAGMFSASYVPENQNGTASNLPSVAIATNVQYNGTISQFAAIWGLNNSAHASGTPTVTDGTDTNSTAYTAGGSNVLLFDNLSTSVFAVPEPSTYALMGLGLLGLTAVVRNRRVQRA